MERDPNRRLTLMQGALYDALGELGTIAMLLTEAGVPDEMSLADRVARVIGERDVARTLGGARSR